MRKFIAMLCLALAVSAPSANAGTAQSPDVVDPAGDATLQEWIASPITLPWADLRSVWLETLRDQNGVATGVAMTMRMDRARATDEEGIDGLITWRHTANPDCEWRLTFDHLPRTTVWKAGSPHTLAVDCPPESGPEPVVPARNWQVVQGRSFTVAGMDYRLEFPLSGVDGTVLAGALTEGTSFTDFKFEIEGYDGPISALIDIATLDRWTIGS